MTNLIKNFLTDEAGASAAEYALILGVIGTAIALSAVALGTAINTSITRATSAVSQGNTAAA
jgi:pilus assembly protein Flp/PilA